MQTRRGPCMRCRAPGAPPDGPGGRELPYGTKDQEPKDQEPMAQRDPRRGSSLPAVVSRLTVLTRLPIASWSRENVVDAQFPGPQELQKADIPVS